MQINQKKIQIENEIKDIENLISSHRSEIKHLREKAMDNAYHVFIRELGDLSPGFIIKKGHNTLSFELDLDIWPDVTVIPLVTPINVYFRFYEHDTSIKDIEVSTFGTYVGTRDIFNIAKLILIGRIAQVLKNKSLLNNIYESNSSLYKKIQNMKNDPSIMSLLENKRNLLNEKRRLEKDIKIEELMSGVEYPNPQFFGPDGKKIKYLKIRSYSPSGKSVNVTYTLTDGTTLNKRVRSSTINLFLQ